VMTDDKYQQKKPTVAHHCKANTFIAQLKI